MAYAALSLSGSLQALLAICVLLAVLSIVPAPLRHVARPLILMSITHPSEYNLSTETAVIAPATGAWWDERNTDLNAGLTVREFDVLGREDLALVLSGLGLGARIGYSFDMDGAVALGHHIGPGALVGISACELRKLPPTSTSPKQVNRRGRRENDQRPEESRS